MRRMLVLFQWLLGGALISYLVFAGLITWNQRALIYHPDPTRTTPERSGLQAVEVLQLNTPDGHRLVHWYAPAKAGQPTLLYFHGNGGGVGIRSERMGDLQRRGYGVAMLSYRGYSGSTGSPSESANMADARLAYDDLRARGVPVSDIILFGESLGTGVATQLAAQVPAAGLILDSPYTSIRDLAQDQFPWLPVDLMLWDRYETSRYIASIKVPVLVLHGEDDTLVPVRMGRAIHAAITSARTLRTYPGAGHLGHVRLGSFDEVERWITTLRRSN
jgi:uncharacterized protein